jgi:hypothetical protein
MPHQHQVTLSGASSQALCALGYARSMPKLTQARGQPAGRCATGATVHGGGGARQPATDFSSPIRASAAAMVQVRVGCDRRGDGRDRRRRRGAAGGGCGGGRESTARQHGRRYRRRSSAGSAARRVRSSCAVLCVDSLYTRSRLAVLAETPPETTHVSQGTLHRRGARHRLVCGGAATRGEGRGVSVCRARCCCYPPATLASMGDRRPLLLPRRSCFGGAFFCRRSLAMCPPHLRYVPASVCRSRPCRPYCTSELPSGTATRRRRWGCQVPRSRSRTTNRTTSFP